MPAYRVPPIPELRKPTMYLMVGVEDMADTVGERNSLHSEHGYQGIVKFVNDWLQKFHTGVSLRVKSFLCS